MRFREIALLTLLISAPLVSSADDESDMKTTASLLSKNIKQINTLGLLRYCENNGLAKPVFQLISNSIVAELDSIAGKPEVDRMFMRAIQAADVQAEGVRTGLKLSQMQPVRKVSFCTEVVEIADDLLDKSEP